MSESGSGSETNPCLDQPALRPDLDLDLDLNLDLSPDPDAVHSVLYMHTRVAKVKNATRTYVSTYHRKWKKMKEFEPPYSTSTSVDL